MDRERLYTIKIDNNDITRPITDSIDDVPVKSLTAPYKIMPRLYSPKLPGTPILGRPITIPVPFTNRPARISPRLLVVFVSICALLGLALHPASPAKSVLPATFGDVEDVDLVTEAHGSGWGWFKDEGRDTVLVTGGAGQLGMSPHPHFKRSKLMSRSSINTSIDEEV